MEYSVFGLPAAGGLADILNAGNRIYVVALPENCWKFIQGILITGYGKGSIALSDNLPRSGVVQ